jgi:TPR repeat protein
MPSQQVKLAWVVAALAITLGCRPPAGPRPRQGWAEREISLERRCQQGSFADCGELGRLLTHEKRDDDDLKRGLVLLEVACGQDDLPACASLGSTYATRIEEGGSAARVREILSKACRHRIATACTGLGRVALEEAQEPEARERWRQACELGDAEGCEYLGALESSDEMGGDRSRAAEAFARACHMGRLSACRRLALQRMRDADSFGQGLELLIGTCDRGHPASCLSAALVFAPTASAHPRCERAMPLARRACSGKQQAGCAIVDACRLTDPTSAGAALADLRSACERKNGLACLYWADAQTDREANQDRLHSAYRTACGDRTPNVQHIACGRLGAIDLPRARTKDETDQAFHLLDHACAESSGQACCDLAQAYKSGTGVAADSNRATELRRKSCELGFARCCGSAPP